MTRTTPPRPVNIAAVFPELAPLARTTTRLHPRPGNPTPQDSSVGGPLLWPINDPWPYCEEEESHYHVKYGPDWSSELIQIKGPIAMLPVAQLYARDIPDLHPPEGSDLLQVLWCPFDHDEAMPKSKLVWRSSSTVTTLLSEPPQPVAVQSRDYVPEPCVVHPEQVIEYPAPLELDEDLRERLSEWSAREKAGATVGSPYYQAESAYYQYELSVAPGWKVGGWGPWSFCDPSPMICDTCGTEMKPLLTISSGDWDGGSGSWIPIEDQAFAGNPGNLSPPPWDPVRVNIGRGYNMQIYICPTSADHPHTEYMQ